MLPATTQESLKHQPPHHRRACKISNIPWRQNYSAPSQTSSHFPKWINVYLCTGIWSPLFKKCSISIWKHDWLISRSDFVILSLPSHSIASVRTYIHSAPACTDFLHSTFSSSSRSQVASVCFWNFCPQISSLLSDFFCTTTPCQKYPNQQKARCNVDQSDYPCALWVQKQPESEKESVQAIIYQSAVDSLSARDNITKSECEINTLCSLNWYTTLLNNCPYRTAYKILIHAYQQWEWAFQ